MLKGLDQNEWPGYTDAHSAASRAEREDPGIPAYGGNLCAASRKPLPLLQSIRIQREEVTAQQGGDPKQHLRVDAVAVEDAVTCHAARAQLAAQPRHRPPLPEQLVVYRLPYVDRVCHRLTGFNRCPAPLPSADKNGVKPSAYTYHQALVNLHNI